jgi:dTDP-4-dehydrorhamnose reductase
MKKILLTGSSGQLGQSILKIGTNHNFDIIATDLDSLDITDSKAIEQIFDAEKPDIVINAAAYTDVDKASQEHELANLVNGKAPGLLAQASKKHNALFIHISTDYVFDGEKTTPYSESDIAEPANFYGKSKLLGEQAVARSGAAAMIIRTAWLYSEFGHNFVKTMMKLAKQGKALRVINDQHGSPTYAGDLAEAVLFLAGNNFSSGVTIFHVTNSGTTTWHGLAEKTFEYADIMADMTGVSTQEYASPTPRPMNSVLSNQRLQMLTGYTMPPWEEGLMRCIKAIENND